MPAQLSTRTITLAATLAMILPSAALAFRAFNRMEVLPVSNGVYEVVSEVGAGPTNYWCGAGDYAQRVLGAGSTDRVYIWQGIGPSVNRPGKKSVQFSLTPPPGADTSTGYSVNVDRPGDNMNVSMAQNYCYDRRADAVQFVGT